jgi:hypothetical protein
VSSCARLIPLLQLLCALAGGKWIVSTDYLNASKKQGVLVQPDLYEFSEEQQGKACTLVQRKKRKSQGNPAPSISEQLVQVSLDAPRHWRLQLLRAFDGLLVCVDVEVLPSRSVMIAVLTCGGATVADSIQRMEQLHRTHRGGFIVRPAPTTNDGDSRTVGADTESPSRWAIVYDIDILLGLCQPLQRQLPFVSTDL